MFINLLILVFSIAIIFGVLHLLQLGMTLKGKLIASIFSGAVAFLGFLSMAYISLLQVFAVMMLFSILAAYFIGYRYNSLVFGKRDRQGVNIRTQIMPVSNNVQMEDDYELEDLASAIQNEQEDAIRIEEYELQPISFGVAMRKEEEPQSATDEYEELLDRKYTDDTYAKDDNPVQMEDIISPLNDLFEEELKKEVIAK